MKRSSNGMVILPRPVTVMHLAAPAHAPKLVIALATLGKGFNRDRSARRLPGALNFRGARIRGRLTIHHVERHLRVGSRQAALRPIKLRYDFFQSRLEALLGSKLSHSLLTLATGNVRSWSFRHARSFTDSQSGQSSSAGTAYQNLNFIPIRGNTTLLDRLKVRQTAARPAREAVSHPPLIQHERLDQLPALEQLQPAS